VVIDFPCPVATLSLSGPSPSHGILSVCMLLCPNVFFLIRLPLLLE
jgi:hypothetical protein